MSWEDILKAKWNWIDNSAWQILAQMRRDGAFEMLEERKVKTEGNLTYNKGELFKEAEEVFKSSATPNEKARYFEDLAEDFWKNSREGKDAMRIADYFNNLESD
jgi:hypothetical protein